MIRKAIVFIALTGALSACSDEQSAGADVIKNAQALGKLGESAIVDKAADHYMCALALLAASNQTQDSLKSTYNERAVAKLTDFFSSTMIPNCSEDVASTAYRTSCLSAYKLVYKSLDDNLKGLAKTKCGGPAEPDYEQKLEVHCDLKKTYFLRSLASAQASSRGEILDAQNELSDEAYARYVGTYCMSNQN